MWKPILAGAVAIAVVGSSMVYAQQRGRPGGFERYQPNIEDMRAFSEARLAALHAGLGLNPDQEKNWPAFEQASREMSKLRIDRVGAAVNRQRDRQPQSNDPADRMHRRAEQMTQSGAALVPISVSIARRSYPQPPDTIADAWEPPGSRPAAFPSLGGRSWPPILTGIAAAALAAGFSQSIEVARLRRQARMPYVWAPRGAPGRPRHRVGVSNPLKKLGSGA